MWIQCYDLLVQSKTQSWIVNLQQCCETESTTEKMLNCLFCGFFENPHLAVELATLFKDRDITCFSHWCAVLTLERNGWTRKEGRREDPEENPSREGETDASRTCGVRGGDNVCVYHNVSAPPPPKKKRNSADDASQMEVWLMSFTSHFHTVKPHQLLVDALQVWSASNLRLGFLKILRLNSRSHRASRLLTIESQGCLLLRSYGHAWVLKRCMRWLCFGLSQPIECLACYKFRRWVVKNSDHPTAGRS